MTPITLAILLVIPKIFAAEVSPGRGFTTLARARAQASKQPVGDAYGRLPPKRTLRVSSCLCAPRTRCPRAALRPPEGLAAGAPWSGGGRACELGAKGKHESADDGVPCWRGPRWGARPGARLGAAVSWELHAAQGASWEHAAVVGSQAPGVGSGGTVTGRLRSGLNHIPMANQ